MTSLKKSWQPLNKSWQPLKKCWQSLKKSWQTKLSGFLYVLIADFAIYCSLFGRLENFLDDFSRFFIFRFRLTENVKSEQGWTNTNTYRANTGVRSCSPEHERTRTRIFKNYWTRTNTNTRVFSSLDHGRSVPHSTVLILPVRTGLVSDIIIPLEDPFHSPCSAFPFVCDIDRVEYPSPIIKIWPHMYAKNTSFLQMFDF